MKTDSNELPDETPADDTNEAAEPTDGGNGRKRRSEGRGGRSHEHHRRGRRSESRGERDEKRHSRRDSRGRGRSSRAQRGDVRAAVLILLAEEPMHGYQLMHAIVDRTQGAWRPSPGAIYPTIAQLEDEGLVTVVADAGRKLVTLTDAGQEYIAAGADTLADPFAAMASEAGERPDLRGAVEQIHSAARAVAKSATDAQVAKAEQVLVQARRDLYLILAEDPTDADAS